MDGVDLLPYLKGEQQGHPHDQLFWHFRNVGALRQGPWKLVKTNSRNQAFELYNLADDQSETTDLAETQPERFARMKATWEAMVSKMSE